MVGGGRQQALAAVDADHHQAASVEVVEEALGGALGSRQAVVDDLAVGTQAEDYRHRALEGAGAGLALSTTPIRAAE